jgi:methyltransferase (TIGR00027 family)
MSTTEIKLPVDHVSDTAYMVALYRAGESERQDAKFKDPFAAKLAAPKAKQLEKLSSFKEEGQWMLTTRTCLIDEHIGNFVRQGGDTVVNLAAGLDTRPYRLDLPKGLRWIEADLPGIIDYKCERLAEDFPKCKLERIALDLRDGGARAQLFDYFDRNAKRSLVITEGLLPYLPETAIEGLATELRNTRTISQWLMDMTTEKFMRLMKHRFLNEESAASQVALAFAPEEGAHYFEKFGWHVTAFESFLEAGERLNRKAPASIQNDPEAAPLLDDSGVALLERANG